MVRYMHYCKVELKQHIKIGPLHSNQSGGNAILEGMLIFFQSFPFFTAAFCSSMTLLYHPNGKLKSQLGVCQISLLNLYIYI